VSRIGPEYHFQNAWVPLGNRRADEFAYRMIDASTGHPTVNVLGELIGPVNRPGGMEKFGNWINDRVLRETFDDDLSNFIPKASMQPVRINWQRFGNSGAIAIIAKTQPESVVSFVLLLGKNDAPVNQEIIGLAKSKMNVELPLIDAPPLCVAIAAPIPERLFYSLIEITLAAAFFKGIQAI